MRIWIDATRHDAGPTVLGMSSLERLLRTLLAAQRSLERLGQLKADLGELPEAHAALSRLEERLGLTEVRIELAPDDTLPRGLSRRLLRGLPIVFAQGQASLRDRLAEALRDADGEPLLALDAQSQVDLRVLEDLARAAEPSAFEGGNGSRRAVAMRLDGPLPRPPRNPEDEPETLLGLSETCLTAGSVVPLKTERDDDGALPRWIFRVAGAEDARQVEHFLFFSQERSPERALPRALYAPTAWRLARRIAEQRAPAASLTLAAIAAGLGAAPFLADGAWALGLAFAHAYGVLTCAGRRLATATLEHSPLRERLEAGGRFLCLPIWALATAWGLAAGDSTSTLLHAAAWISAITLFARTLEPEIAPGPTTRLRRLLTGPEPSLAILTLGWGLGLTPTALTIVLILQAATAASLAADLYSSRESEANDTKPARAPSTPTEPEAAS